MSAPRRLVVLFAGLACLLARAEPLAAQAQVLLDVHGTQTDQYLGHSVDGLGDVDGDGVPDLVVGESEVSETPAHFVRILSGTDGAQLYAFEYSDFGLAVAGVGDLDADGRGDFAVGLPDDGVFEVRSVASGHALLSGDNDVGYGFADFFGWSVSSAGDVNADGVPDIVAGSGANGWFDYGGDLLRVYSGADGSLLHQDNKYQYSVWPQGIGWSVDGLGDVNGDGFGDVVAGIPLKDGWMGGKIVVYSGADFSPLYTILGGGGLGWSTANAGDVDGDGIDDIVSATMNASGHVDVYSGATAALLLRIDDIPGYGVFSGLDVDGLGDIDGDGHSDLVVGRIGAVLFYSGDDGRLLMAYEDLPGGGTSTYFFNRVDVASAGDIDGDGRNDVVAGNRFDDTNATNAGRVLVISSQPEPWTDLGFALAGAGGAPTLSGAGTLAAGSPGFLRLLGAPTSAPGLLFVGFSALEAPFKGGTLVPTPHLSLSLSSSPTGTLTLPWSSWPAGLPSFSSIWFQIWLADATAPAGACATNALLATTPAP